jgi:50S ribosomal protein L16 3-hydroxylase
MRRAPVLKPELDSLIWPLTRKEFLSTYWGKRHFIQHAASARRIERLAQDLGSLEVDKLVAQCPEVLVWYQSAEGTFKSIKTRPHEALDLYNAGMTLYFDLSRIAAAHAWSSAVARGLGLPPDRVLCSAFASRSGGGVQCHFDANENFTLQLRGRKRWHVHRNEHVERPTMNWVTTLEVPEELRGYTFEPLPRQMPPGAEAVELRAGTVLYVPRGYWHATDTSEDSLSLNICLPQTSWVDVLLPALRTALVRHAKWREWPVGMFGSPQERAEAHQRLARLLEELPEDLRSLGADSLLPPPAPSALPRGRKALLQRNPVVSLSLDRPSGKRRFVLRILRRRPLEPQRVVELELSAGLAAVCRWLAHREAPFRRAELQAAVPRVPLEEMEPLLQELWEMGALLPREDSSPAR